MKISLPEISKIFKSKILIISAAVVVLIAIAVLIISNIVITNKKEAAALDFSNDLPSDLDEIFADTTNESMILNEEDQKEIYTVLESINTNTTETSANTNSEVRSQTPDTINTPINIDMTNVVAQDLFREENIVEEKTEIIEETYNDAKPFIEEIPEKEIQAKNVTINSFIIDDKNATRANPTFITIVSKATSDAVYIKVKIFARQLSSSNEPITRSLIFGLPKVYVINGQAQTQFYWAGRTFMSAKYLKKARYILYAEIEAYDKNHKRIGVSGRYSMPKFDNIITLR